MSTHAMGEPWAGGRGPADFLRMVMTGWRGWSRDDEEGERHEWAGADQAHGRGEPHGHGSRGEPHGHGERGGHRRGRGRRGGGFDPSGQFWPFGPEGPFGPRGPWGTGPLGDPRLWGRHGRPPFGPGGPRARRGDVRAAALALLAERPMNGYQVIQEIKERSGGMWKPSSGSVYPALQQLEDEGLIQAGEHEGRRAFSLTAQGRKYVEDNPDEIRAPWAAFDSSAGEAAMELRELIGQVAVAFVQVITTGTGQQVDQAKQVINETRRALYRILADDHEDDRPVDASPGDGGGGER